MQMRGHLGETVIDWPALRGVFIFGESLFLVD